MKQYQHRSVETSNVKLYSEFPSYIQMKSMFLRAFFVNQE